MGQDPYSTHQQLLTAAALATTGPIIEVGGGYYSTPILSSIAHFANRNVFTVETEDGFYRRLRRFGHARHKIIKMDGFPFENGKFIRGLESHLVYLERQDAFLQKLFNRHGRFGLAFIDQRPGFLRHGAAKFFAPHADMVLIHDSQQAEHYFLESAFAAFKYRYDFTMWRANTTALSNFLDCEQIFSFLPKGPPYKSVPLSEEAKARRIKKAALWEGSNS